MKNFLWALFIGIVLFELIEHVFYPLIWSFLQRRRKPLCGIEGLPGKTAEVKRWDAGTGFVSVEGELWKAVGPAPLHPGDKVVIVEVEGLTLKVNHRIKENP